MNGFLFVKNHYMVFVFDETSPNDIFWWSIGNSYQECAKHLKSLNNEFLRKDIPLAKQFESSRHFNRHEFTNLNRK
jgi:hypothetical protein